MSKLDPNKLKEMIDPKHFNEELKKHVGIVKSTLDAGCDAYMPKLAINGYNFETHDFENILMAFTDFPEDKHKMMHMAGRKLAEEKPHFYPIEVFFSSEAWFRAFEKGEEPRYPLGPEPVKTEAIIVSGMNMVKNENMYIGPVGRGKSGKMMILKDKEKWNLYEKTDKQGLQSYIVANFFQGFADERVHKDKI